MGPRQRQRKLIHHVELPADVSHQTRLTDLGLDQLITGITASWTHQPDGIRILEFKLQAVPTYRLACHREDYHVEKNSIRAK